MSLILCAILLSTWLGGVGPGLLATLFGTFSFYYYFLSPNQPFVAKPEEIPRFAALVVSSLFFFGLGLAQRSATELLRRRRDPETDTVKALKKTNGALGRTEAYLAEAQSLSHTGSFALEGRCSRGYRRIGGVEA